MSVSSSDPVAESESGIHEMKKIEGDGELLAARTPSPVEVDDPAILVRGPQTPITYRYTHEEMLKLRTNEVCKKRPDCLDDVAYNNRGCFVPDCWNIDRKRSDTPNDDDRIGREFPPENHKRRSGDPRDRIRKEQDGIVLSPQRRSFNTGCFMPVTQTITRRPESPLGKDRELAFTKDRDLPARRIGSGRILARDVSWDFRPEKPEIDEFSFRPGGGLRERERDERYERRSFGRDFDREKDPRHRDSRERDRDSMDRPGRNVRYSAGERRRAFSDCRDDEPEWFSGGPTSQLDTIELRGFEDIPEEKTNIVRKKQSPPQKKLSKKDKDKDALNNTAKDKDTSFINIENESKDKSRSLLDSGKINIDDSHHSSIQESPHARSTPTSENKISQNDKEEMCNSPIPPALQMDSSIINMSVADGKIDHNGIIASDSGFNIDDYLKIDCIPSLLTNGASGETAGSRFSQWFRRESPVTVTRPDSRRSSLQEELNNMLNEPNIQIPHETDSNKYFAPISPAANSNDSPASNSLLEMLQRGKKQTHEPHTVPELPAGKIHSLEELEARMRHGVANGPTGPEKPVNKAEDMLAFKKLLAQVSGGQAVQATNGPITQKPQPMSIMEMLNKSQQADENAGRMGPLPNMQGHPAMGNTPGAFVPTQTSVPTQNTQIPTDLVVKLLHVQQQQRQQQQQEVFQKFVTGMPRHFQTSPLPSDIQNMMGSQHFNRDLLQRPEAQAILQGLKRGEISHQNLIQQLNNPAMQQRHRDVLLTILKSQGAPLNLLSPNNVSPTPPQPSAEMLQHLMFPQQQQLRVSPLPPNAYCVSPIMATSPNTLTIHHPAMPQRIPSPRELQAHTQSIMQSALIKKKLEEQRENFRKRQELQRTSSPNGTLNTSGGTGGNSPAKNISSPTPLAFTPTSVLRKMTAEKEPDIGIKDMKDTNKLISNMQNLRPSNQNRQTMPINWNSLVKQPQGRAIVKGGGGTTSQQAPGQMQYNSSNIDYQQQLHNQFQANNANSQRSKMNMQSQAHINMQQNYNMQQFNNLMHRPGMAAMGNGTHRAQQIQAQIQAQQAQMQRGFPPQLVASTMLAGPRPKPGMMGFNNQREGALSPTSNQLARWFSPELLAQASAGKLPPVNLAQNALSLEELERIQQSSTTVHN